LQNETDAGLVKGKELSLATASVATIGVETLYGAPYTPGSL